MVLKMLVQGSRLGGRPFGTDNPEEGDPVSALLKLHRHLQGDGCAQAVSQQQIGSFRPRGFDRFDIVRGHLCHGGERSLLAVEARGLQAVDRLVGSELSGELAVQQRRPGRGRDTEQRAPFTGGL